MTGFWWWRLGGARWPFVFVLASAVFASPTWAPSSAMLLVGAVGAYVALFAVEALQRERPTQFGRLSPSDARALQASWRQAELPPDPRLARAVTQVALRRSKNLPQPRTFAFLAAAGLAAALVGGAVSNLALASEGALVIALAAVSYAWDVHTRPRARAILTQTQAREGQTPDAAPTAQPVPGRLLQSPGPAWAWGLVLLMATGVGTLATWHPQQATAAQPNNELSTLAAIEEAHHRATGTYTTTLTVPSASVTPRSSPARTPTASSSGTTATTLQPTGRPSKAPARSSVFRRRTPSGRARRVAE